MEIKRTKTQENKMTINKGNILTASAFAIGLGGIAASMIEHQIVSGIREPIVQHMVELDCRLRRYESAALTDA